MAKLSLTELRTLVSTYVTENGISSGTYTETRANISGLLDKIGKVVTLDTNFVDKLAIFDGEFLSLGKDIEEWSQDLILPQTYDNTGANALAPHDPTYRPAFYSKSLGRKNIPTTIRNNNFERAVNNPEELIALTSMILKKLYDSETSYEYALKREILGDVAKMCNDAMNTQTSFATNTQYAVGTYVKSGNDVGVVVKAIASSNTNNYATCIANGYIINLALVETIAKPVDTATAEAFVKAVKNDVEIASDESEGHSLNGNTLGATSSPILIMGQGIQSVLDVDMLAGAFHTDKLTLPAVTTVIKDFGANAPTGTYAVLCDSRMIRLHATYKAIRQNENGEGDFINYFLHSEFTGYASRNCFVKVYKSE